MLDPSDVSDVASSEARCAYCTFVYHVLVVYLVVIMCGVQLVTRISGAACFGMSASYEFVREGIYTEGDLVCMSPRALPFSGGLVLFAPRPLPTLAIATR